jgi:hypothetical protein
MSLLTGAWSEKTQFLLAINSGDLYDTMDSPLKYHSVGRGILFKELGKNISLFFRL